MALRPPTFAGAFLAMLFGIFSQLTMLAAARQASPKIVSFPPQSQAASLDGRYLIIEEGNHAEPFHTAILEDRSLNTRRKLFDYDRGIDLLWNSDSKSFAVTDYEGSHYSRCRIIVADQTAQTIQVWDKLIAALTTTERKSLLENHHVYIAAANGLAMGRSRSRCGATVKSILRASHGFIVTIKMEPSNA